MRQLIRSVRVSARNYAEQAEKIRARRVEAPRFEREIRRIVGGVRDCGDVALVDFVRRFDGANISPGRLRVPQRELDDAPRRIEPGLARALRFSLNQIRRVQGAVLQAVRTSSGSGGFEVKVDARPLSAVGCYVPGGRASYASSVLMTAGVAKLAGVERIVLCTPLQGDAGIDRTVLAAASIAGVDEVYSVGGAHAIAAMAYGTESIRPVRKIVGPGGRYVAAAKRLVSADVETDFYAGPTELVVFADESCEPRIAAWDLIGQAEHGEDSLCGLLTNSEEYAALVRSEIRKILPGVERRKYVEGCLANGFAAICRNEKAACGFLNSLAPEHLEIMTSDPMRIASMVGGAGLKLVGKYAPCAASDYAIGTDHVIPTAGFSALRGCLSVLDFVKLDWTVKGSKEGLRNLLRPIRALAYSEGLPNHFLSAASRFGDRAA